MSELLRSRSGRVIAPRRQFVAITGHQRQIDHHGALLFSPFCCASRPRRGRWGGNIGTGVLWPLQPPAAESAVTCWRLSVVPDRAHAHPGADGGRGAQCHAGPSRPPRHGGALRRGEGTPGGWLRDGRYRHRRRLHARDGWAGRAGEPPLRVLGRCAGSLDAMFFAQGQTLLARDGDGGAAVEIASVSGVRSLRGRHNIRERFSVSAAIRALDEKRAAQGKGRGLFKPEALQHSALFRPFPGLAAPG